MDRREGGAHEDLEEAVEGSCENEEEARRRLGLASEQKLVVCTLLKIQHDPHGMKEMKFPLVRFHEVCVTL